MPRGRAVVLLALWFTVQTVLALMLFNLLDIAGLIAAAAHVAIGAFLYVYHGKNNISGLGVYSIGSMLFLGVPFFFVDVANRIEHHYMAAVVAFLGYAIVVFFVIARDSRGVFTLTVTAPALDFYSKLKVSWPLSLLIVTGIAGASLLTPLDILQPLEEGVYFLAVTYFALLGIGYYTKKRLIGFLLALLAVAVCFALYYTLQFDAFGRLRVVALGLCVLMAMSLISKTRILKVATILASPLVVYWGVITRVGYFDLVDERGLGSVFGPFKILTAIIQYVDLNLLNLTHGRTYLYPFYFWVPRDLWESKPLGLGAEVVLHFQPHLFGTGHSLAVSYVGEGVLNFGLLGFIPAAIIAVVLLQLSSRLADSALALRRGILTDPLLMCAAIVLQVSLLDFVWGDSNTFTQRGMTRLLVIGSFILLAFGLQRIYDAFGRKHKGAHWK